MAGTKINISHTVHVWCTYPHLVYFLWHMSHVGKYTIHGCNGNVLYDWHRRSGIAPCVFNPTNDCNTKKIHPPKKKKTCCPPPKSISHIHPYSLAKSISHIHPYSLAEKVLKKKLFSLFVPYFHPTRKLQAALYDDSVYMGVPAGWLRTLRKRLSILRSKKAWAKLTGRKMLGIMFFLHLSESHLSLFVLCSTVTDRRTGVRPAQI